MGSHALTRIPPVGECSFLKGLTRIDLAREQRRIVPRTSTAWSPSLWVRLRPRTSSCSRPRRRPGQEDRAPRRADRREPREPGKHGPRRGVNSPCYAPPAAGHQSPDAGSTSEVAERHCHRVRFHSDRRRRVIRGRGNLSARLRCVRPPPWLHHLRTLLRLLNHSAVGVSAPVRAPARPHPILLSS